ncbi:PepSY domain-containing protein [Kamptonema cortianum]|uniref:PepSY domain-containing protein n=1 Tax=Geitlerinema calcuttense NRMC-F 0142 TaxID=2922238 RepID=A0ABT7M2I7_9CYAN|nr:PepSY domain-containing protein [Geitlerinema calcuttense]MDK3158287.1 PepSY domain-containing protein [Kamptonema cortianum]MDL5057271.1 PepSY domain-containing protein [Geitlerinema calcuttense NRMC-F 0142]
MRQPFSAGIDTEPALETGKNLLYRAVWRWHFYAGLFVIPFLLMLATTGIIYLFKPQLDAAIYRPLLFVQPTAETVSYTQQVEAVQQAYPEAAVTRVFPAVAANRSTEVQILTGDGENWMVFVNPHTGQILGDRNEERTLSAIALKLHGELMIGRWGDYLIELAACWGLVLLLSGLYLWLPRGRFRWAGTLIPRLGNPDGRVFWRDLHAVPGFYGLLLVGFLILTGLPWTGFWGATFANVWARFPDQKWQNVPQSTVLTGTLNQHGEHAVPWAAETLPMPQSGHHAHSGAIAQTQATVDLDQIIGIARASGISPGFNISLPQGETGVYTVAAPASNPTQEVTMHIDQYSGEVLAQVGWQDYGWVPKAVSMGIAIHMGQYLGLSNQLLMLLACLITILLCVSGAVMWWKRRPSGRLGAPARSPIKVPLAIVAVLGLAFPLLGFSLVLVLALDFLVIARIPALRRTLS